MDTYAPSISPREIALRIGKPDAPLILDVRRQVPYDESLHCLATALRCPPSEVSAFAKTSARREIVVYCVYGHDVSADAVAILKEAGWNARLMAGGIAGGQEGVDDPEKINEWRSVRPLTIRKRPDLGVTGKTPSRWITRERPKIDRIACPWLIRRFIDRHAEFFYVPTSAVFLEAKRLGAVAYDIPGAPISHEGELCSFDTLLAAFDLQDDPTLGVLARIVRAADTDRLELAQQAAGLLAFSLGLSSLHASNDAAMLDAAMPLYDALYAWCRQQADGQAEGHSWKPEAMKAVQA